jgi:hypothetical protein
MQGEIDKVQIANWSIFGNTIIVPKKNETTETFVTLGRCLDCTPGSKQSIIGGFAPYTEGFDNYTYTAEMRQKYKLSESKDEFNKYIRAVEEKQINPLQKKAAQYEEDVENITVNHQNISNTLLAITNSEQNGLLDEMKKHPSYINSTKGHATDSVEDARLNDINQMINTNNEIYVLGGIATATLLVFSGMLWMKQ